MSKQSFQTGHPPPVGFHGPVFGAAVVLQPAALTNSQRDGKGVNEAVPEVHHKVRSIVANPILFLLISRSMFSKVQGAGSTSGQVAVQVLGGNDFLSRRVS